jgi:outer membrane receptor protein involved in Fe transport
VYGPQVGEATATVTRCTLSTHAAERANAIEEVVVTARRREETAQSVSIPITAISGDEMREQAANGRDSDTHYFTLT